MIMTNKEMLSTVQTQLAIDMNCNVDDFNGEKDSIVFTLDKKNPGHRPFPRGDYHFQMISMGKAIVISASEVLLPTIKEYVNGKTRDEVFSAPFVNGQGLYYLPDLGKMPNLPAPGGFQYVILERADIPAQYSLEGFRNAIQYNVDHPRPDVLLTLAKHNDTVVGMAGASLDCSSMWQIGMDVLPQARNNGLAAYLVNRLAHEILGRGIVPYYATATSNIASQRVAHRAGFAVAWVNAYRGVFPDYEILPTC